MYKLSEFEAQQEMNRVYNLLGNKKVLNCEEYLIVTEWDKTYEKVLYPIGNDEFLNLILEEEVEYSDVVG